MLTDYFIKRPVLSLVISTMIVLLGVQAFFDTQVRQYPELETSIISITTAYPGASAELIQGFISTPIQQVVSSTEESISCAPAVATASPWSKCT